MRPALPRPVARLVEMLSAEYADAQINVVAPRSATADWKLMFQRAAVHCSIYWHDARGFEIFVDRDTRARDSVADRRDDSDDLELRIRWLMWCARRADA